MENFSGSPFSQKVPLKSGLYSILKDNLFEKKDKHPNFERDIVTEFVNLSVVTWNIQ